MNKADIKKCLSEFGLKNGDVVIVHSSLASIGHVEGGADTLIDAFLETIGNEGTLVAPVFGNLGIFTHTLKKRPEAFVSDCPLGTVAAVGADAEFICRDHWKADTVHGNDSPYLKIAGLGGYVCLLGVDQDRNTTLHSVEALLELSYLGTKKATLESGSEKSGKKTCRQKESSEKNSKKNSRQKEISDYHRYKKSRLYKAAFFIPLLSLSALKRFAFFHAPSNTSHNPPSTRQHRYCSIQDAPQPF